MPNQLCLLLLVTPCHGQRNLTFRLVNCNPVTGASTSLGHKLRSSRYQATGAWTYDGLAMTAIVAVGSVSTDSDFKISLQFDAGESCNTDQMPCRAIDGDVE